MFLMLIFAILFITLWNISAYFLMDYAVQTDNNKLYNVCQFIMYYTYMIMLIIWVLAVIFCFLFWLLYIVFHLSNILA